MKKLLKNFPIRLKMIASHGTIAVLSLFCATVALFGIKGLIANLTTIHEDAMMCVDAASDLMFASADIERSILGIVAENSAVYVDMMEENVESDISTIHAAFETFDAHLGNFGVSKTATDLVDEIYAMFIESESVRQQVMDYLSAGNIEEAHSLYINNYRISLSRIINDASSLEAELSALSDAYCSKALQVNNLGVLVILILVFVSLILGTYLTHIVSDSVRLPVTQLMDASEQMKQGNLAVAENITYESGDEIGVLAASMRETLLFLHSYISEISDTLHKVANGDLRAENDSITEFRGDFASIRESLTYILDNLNLTLGSIHQAAAQVNDGAVQIAAGAQSLAQDQKSVV